MRSEECWKRRTTYKAPQYPFYENNCLQSGTSIQGTTRYATIFFLHTAKIGEHLEPQFMLHETMDIKAIRCARRPSLLTSNFSLLTAFNLSLPAN